MKTAFQTGPGFYPADSSSHDRALPPKTMRVYCARIEAYDLPYEKGEADEIEFEVLFAKGEDDPRVAKALLKLAEAIDGNRELLEEQAAKG